MTGGRVDVHVLIPAGGGHAVGGRRGRERESAALRRGDVPAVVGRIEGGRLLLDLRAVAPADDERLAAAVLAAAALAATAADGASSPGRD